VTALLLARWEMSSTALEAAPERDDAGSRAICPQRDVLEVFDPIGCAAPPSGGRPRPPSNGPGEVPPICTESA
jgi:2-polyprenyl-6-methoxyphenol hydroxylase-like FAD-dependent oxidoreductase